MGEMLLLLLACDEEVAPEEEPASDCWVKPLLLGSGIVPSAIMLSTVLVGAFSPVVRAAGVAAAADDDPAPLLVPPPPNRPEIDNFIAVTFQL